MPNPHPRYSRLTITLHWSMLLLIAAVYACMEFKGIFPKGSPGRDNIQSCHFMLGLCVLALALIRVVVALVGKTPPIVPAPPKWQSRLALLMKLALYAFMVATPLLGWLLLSAKGAPIPFFGLQLPGLTVADKATASSIKEIHETLATLGYFLIGGHAAAALFHHYLVRDNTLLRMLGSGRRTEA